MDSLRHRANQELSKDMMLEKLVLLTVGYFCIGTEHRFIYMKSKQGGNDVDDEVSEVWLARALRT